MKNKKIGSVLLLLVVSAAWLWFFSGATFSNDDWPEQVSYASVVQDAIQLFQLPWFSDKEILFGTNKLMLNCMVDLSPTALLLKLFTVKQFFVIEFLIFSGIGVIGCVKLANYWGMNWVAAFFLVAMSQFNGFVLAQIAVGHKTMEPILFLPWLIYYYSFLRDSVCSERRIFPINLLILKISLVLVGSLLIGGIHPFTWFAMLLAMLVVFDPRVRWHLSKAIFIAVGLSFWRIFPEAWRCWGLQHPFLSGYPSLNILLSALTQIGNHETPIMGTHIAIRWWEYSMFIGVGAFFSILLFNFFIRCGNCKHLAALMVSGVVFFYIAASDVWLGVHLTRLPLSNSEAVSSRFMVMALFIAAFFAADSFSQWDFKHKKWIGWAVMCGMMFELFENAIMWRPANFNVVVGEPSHILTGFPDFQYQKVVGVPIFISALFALFVVRRIFTDMESRHEPIKG